MEEKNFIISLTQLNTLLAYLQNRPFKEVVSLIGVLNNVSKVEHGDVAGIDTNIIENTVEETQEG